MQCGIVTGVYWCGECRSVEMVFFFFKQMTASELRIRDWDSDLCASDLVAVGVTADQIPERIKAMQEKVLACTGKTPERYLVQEMVGEGVEMILGFHRDPIGDAIQIGRAHV